MLRKIHFCLLAGLIFTPAFSQQRVVDYVNPIIGTNGMGHTFPGPCVPFGLIQLSPDTDTIPHNINGTPIRDKIAISCMLRQIHESSSHAIRHGLYIKNRKRLFCP